MGMEDYEVNGMGYEKASGDRRIEYMTANRFGHTVVTGLITCRLCGRQARPITAVTEVAGGFIEAIHTIYPAACRYSEV